MSLQKGLSSSIASGRDRKLKKSQLFAICIAQINEAIQITMPVSPASEQYHEKLLLLIASGEYLQYTLAVYMVRDFLGQSDPEGASEQRVGRLTGLLAACFCAAQFVSSFPWGRASDKIGRRPMVVMSNLSSCLSVVGFGLSNSFTTAAICRIIGGLFNCTFVCLKSMIGESCDIDQQARPLSYLSLCWGVGTVIGPSLGGALSRPCEEFGEGFPFCRDNGLLARRPFLLPCLAVGSVSFVAFVSSLLVMSETLPRLVEEDRGSQEVSGSSDEMPSKASMPTETELAHRPSNRPADLEEGYLEQHSGSFDSEDGSERLALLSPKDSAHDFERRQIKTTTTPEEDDSQPASFTPREGLDESSAKTLTPELGSGVHEDKSIVWYKNRQTIQTITGYVMICLLYNLLDEVTPIYSSADRDLGGLGLSTSQLAVPLSIGGISIFLWSMFFYPAYQGYFGSLNACRLGLVMTIPLCVGLALPSLFSMGTLGLQLFLAAILFVKNIMATNSFTSAVMMVNAAAPQEAIGAVNGASQGAASFVRAVGPALGGLMWALSVSIKIPGHQVLAFAVTGAGFLGPLMIYSC